MIQSKIIFEADMVLEYSSTPTPTPLGKAKCDMELIIHEGGEEGSIIWGIEYEDGEDDEIGIGLWFEDKKVTGYDGVFSLPIQAIELLKLNGFDTSEVEEED